MTQTVPCRPWCRYQDGHNRLADEDQVCASTPIVLHVGSDAAGLYQPPIAVVTVQSPGDTDPFVRVYLHLDTSVDLSADEGRLLIGALQAELDRPAT